MLSCMWLLGRTDGRWHGFRVFIQLLDFHMKFGHWFVLVKTSRACALLNQLNQSRPGRQVYEIAHPSKSDAQGRIFTDVSMPAAAAEERQAAYFALADHPGQAALCQASRGWPGQLQPQSWILRPPSTPRPECHQSIVHSRCFIPCKLSKLCTCCSTVRKTVPWSRIIIFSSRITCSWASELYIAVCRDSLMVHVSVAC